MSANDIRKSINILNESVNTNNINEAAPMGFLKKLATKAASLLDQSREGDLEIGEIANQWYNEYKKYLRGIGRTAPNVKDGTVGDLFAFFTGTGFHYKSIIKGLEKAIPDDEYKIKSQKDLNRLKNTPLKPNTAHKAFLYIMQFQKEKPQASLEPKYWGQKKHTPVRDTSSRRLSDTPPPSGPPSLSDENAKALLQSVLGSSNVTDDKVNALITALKNAGLIS